MSGTPTPDPEGALDALGKQIDESFDAIIAQRNEAREERDRLSARVAELEAENERLLHHLADMLNLIDNGSPAISGPMRIAEARAALGRDADA